MDFQNLSNTNFANVKNKKIKKEKKRKGGQKHIGNNVSSFPERMPSHYSRPYGANFFNCFFIYHKHFFKINISLRN